MDESWADWEAERQTLLTRNISDLGLSIEGTRVERMVTQLYAELEAHDLAFRPPVYLSDQWGCPEATPIIGVPFYLADPRLERIEDDFAEGIESDQESMRFMRHEAGHAFNYAYRLFDRGDWRQTFGPYSQPYRDRYHADPFSHEFVRHILGWYAQKHPDEDFAETFAVWLTPGLDWRKAYADWPALQKLEYVERIAREIGIASGEPVVPGDDDLPVSAMTYSLADHYSSIADNIPMHGSTTFDGDLGNIFATAVESPIGQSAAEFLVSHRREIVGRIAYWTGEAPSAVRGLVDLLGERAGELKLRVRGLEASTLIELTAFGTTVMMNYRNASIPSRRPRKPK
ncbi:MAG: putative zinc-binding metallopeptidase [Gemmatimonadaceae bacterium]